MKEQDLIELGFNKETETPENGGYHYYTNGELLSNDSDSAEADGWIVTLYGEKYDYHFTNTKDVKTLVGLLDKNKVKSGFDASAFGL